MAAGAVRLVGRAAARRATAVGRSRRAAARVIGSGVRLGEGRSVGAGLRVVGETGGVLAVGVHAVEAGVGVRRAAVVRRGAGGRPRGCGTPGRGAEERREALVEERLAVPQVAEGVVDLVEQAACGAGGTLGLAEAERLALLVARHDGEDQRDEREGHEGQRTGLEVLDDPDDDAAQNTERTGHTGVRAVLDRAAELRSEEHSEQLSDETNAGVIPCVTHDEPLSGIHATDDQTATCHF